MHGSLLTFAGSSSTGALRVRFVAQQVRLRQASGLRDLGCGLLCLLAFVNAAYAIDAASVKRAFTVRDSIAWTHLIPPDAATSSPSSIALFSPAGTWFVVRTRRGDLERNVNVETLLLYRTADVERYARSARDVPVPQPRTLTEVPVLNDWEYISGVQWLNDSELGFISKGANGRMQAFSANAETRFITQLTFSDTDVVAFGRRRDVLVYFSRADSRRSSQVTVVESQSLSELLAGPDDPDWLEVAPIEAFVNSPGQSGATKLALPAMWIDPSMRRVWIAPSGRYAILLAPATNAPVHWAAYEIPDYGRFGFSAQWVRNDPKSLDLGNRVRYMIADLRTQQVRPLLDAPSGAITFNGTPREVFWDRNERSVIVSNTYLPLNVADHATHDARLRRPAIAEVDIETGEATAIVWEEVETDSQRTAGQRQKSSVTRIDWHAEADVLCAETRQSSDGALRSECFSRQRNHSWGSSDSLRAPARRREHLQVKEFESLSERPTVRVTILQDDAPSSAARDRILLDPNPQADALAFGTTRLFEWKDSKGIQWVGGLLLPPDYVRGTRYPLVMQTHGFGRNRFLLDGPPPQATTAFAAQALANAGIVVLQVQDPPRAIAADQQEGPDAADGYYAAIEQLIADGIVDGSRVGLIAFSRTGYHALHLLAKYPRLLKAVTISDALQAGYWQYITVAGNRTDSEISVSRLTGGAPELGTIKDWFARNPIYKISESAAAILLEETGRSAGLGMWETYAMLRRSGRPVEFVLFREGSHLLKKPLERLASQGGNVDWYRFWLQGYEDSVPQKQAQYVRWHALREAARRQQ